MYTSPPPSPSPTSADTPLLRLSTYTRIIDVHDGTSVVLNLPRKVADQVPTDQAHALEGDLGDADPQWVRYATRVGYLTHHSREEERDWFRQLVAAIADVRRDGTIATLSLVTTNTCNLACSYCFQSDTGMRDIPQRFMTLSQAKESFAAIDRLVDSGQVVSHIELFGGEPLLPSTRKVVEYAVLEAERRGLVTRATSNGVFLDRFADLLGPTRIYDLQVTLDGSARYHDERRIGRNRQPTFDRILANIELAVDRNVDVDIRANIDRRNIDGLVELIEVLDSRELLDAPNVEFTWVNVWPDEAAEDDINSGFFMTRVEIDAHLAQHRSSHPALAKVIAPPTPLTTYLSKIMADPQIRFCGAGSNNLFVSPESLVYSCDEHVGQPHRAVATIDDDAHITPLPLWDVWRDRRIDKLANCVDCSVALAHGGGCGAKLSDAQLSRYGACGTFPADFDNEVRRLALVTEP